MAYQRNPGEDLVWNENRGECVSANCTLTVSVSPNDATVVLTATGYPQVGNTISVPSGTSVTYTVSKTGYTTVTDTVTVTQDQTINVQLSLLYVLTINPTPANAYVVLTATGYTQSGNTIAVPANTSVSYIVHKGGYNTISSTVTVTQTTSVSVTLTTNAIHEISVGGNVYDVYSKGMLNQNGADEYVYNWIGTLQEYNTQNIATLHPDWVCLITDDNPAGESVNIYTKAQIDEMLTNYYTKSGTDSALVDLLFDIYPVGTIYGGNVTTCPLIALMPGTTWDLLPANKALWTGTGSNQGTTKEAGLPNITGEITSPRSEVPMGSGSGAFYSSNSGTTYAGGSSYSLPRTVNFDASRSSSVYGNSDTVQPDAYVSNFWIRTA